MEHVFGSGEFSSRAERLAVGLLLESVLIAAAASVEVQLAALVLRRVEIVQIRPRGFLVLSANST